MALIICKECRRQFSDLAQACPGCAAPTAYSLDNPVKPVTPLTPITPEHLSATSPVTPPAIETVATQPDNGYSANSQPLTGSIASRQPYADPMPGIDAAPATPSAYQFVSDHTLEASDAKTRQPARRQVGVLLLLAIFIFPWIFYWLLLRSGHSALARLNGICWLLLYSAIVIFLLPDRPYYGNQVPQQPVPEVQQTTATQPSVESGNPPVFYPLPGLPGKNDASSNPLPDTQGNTTNMPPQGITDPSGIPAEQQEQATDSSDSPSLYATQDDDQALHDGLSACLVQQADSGNYSAADGGKSAARMISRCYADFKPWFDRCVANQQNVKLCNMDAVDLAQATLKLSGY